MLTDAQLSRIQDLLDATTPGEWARGVYRPEGEDNIIIKGVVIWKKDQNGEKTVGIDKIIACMGMYAHDEDGRLEAAAVTPPSDQVDANLDFILHARDLVTDLLWEVQDLRAQLAGRRKRSRP